MNKKIKITIIAFLLFLAGTCYAQELKIESFTEAQNIELVPNRDTVNDINGKLCALIKVQIIEDTVSFEGGVSRYYKKAQNEWWVWISTDAKRMTIISGSSFPTTVTFGDYGFEHLKDANKRTYILRFVKSFDKINAFSFVVPGLGQIEMGHKTEGYAILASEILLLSGSLSSSISAKKQLEIIRDVDVSLSNYLTAKNKYNIQKIINATCNIGAIALYGFHLYRVYHLSKRANKDRYVSVSPTIINASESAILGVNMSIKL